MSEPPLISTRDRPGQFDGLESAKPSEPIFVIQGGDPLGPPTVQFWADQARAVARVEDKPELRRKLLKKANSAEETAWAMTDYQRDPDHVERVAEEKRFSSEDVTDRNVILARAADRLHNALAEAVTVAETLEATDEVILKSFASRIRDAAETMKDVAQTFEPRRHMRRK